MNWTKELSGGFHLETRAVLAGAYKNQSYKTALTHLCLVPDGNSEVAQVVCQRVKPDHMADPYAMDPNTTPSCERCARVKR